MVVNVENSYQNIIQKNVLEKIFERPALLILFLYAVGVYFMANYLGTTRSFLIPNLLLFTPSIPVILLENKWIKNHKKENIILFYDVIKINRNSFIFTGFISSFLIILTAYMMEMMFKVNSTYSRILGVRYFYSIKISSILAIVVATLIINMFIVAAFYRVRAEEHDTGKRYTFISSPIQVVTLISYSFIGIFTSIWLLWMGSILVSPPEVHARLSIEAVTDGSFTFILIMYISILFATAYGSKMIPYLIKDGMYRRPERPMLKKWTRDIIFFVLVISYFAYIRYNSTNVLYTSDWLLYDTTLLIILPFLFYLMVRKYQIGGKTCKYCNLLLYNDECMSCRTDEIRSLPYISKKKKKISYATCSRCKQVWDELSLKCNKHYNCDIDNCDGSCDNICGFTISLTCEYCGSPVNPLWKKCATCNRDRVNIIDKALRSPGSEGYVRSMAYSRFLIAIIIPLIIFQIVSLISVVISILLEKYSLDDQYYVYFTLRIGAVKLAVMIMALTGLIGLMITTSKENTRSLGLIANRYAIIGGSILMQTIFTVYFFKSISDLFSASDSKVITRILVFAISAFFFSTSIKANFKLLLSFRPINPFNPKLALKNRIDVR